MLAGVEELPCSGECYSPVGVKDEILGRRETSGDGDCAQNERGAERPALDQLAGTHTTKSVAIPASAPEAMLRFDVVVLTSVGASAIR